MTNSIVRVYHAGGYRPAYTHMSKPTKPRRRIKRRRTALNRMAQTVKRVKWGNVTIAVLATVGAVHMASTAYGAITGPDAPADVPQAAVITAPAMPSARNDATEQPTLPVEYIFRDGDGAPVDLETMTSAWAAYGTAVRYTLTDAERYEIASVVTAETTGEPYAGMMAVAQCILQSCEDDGIRPIKAIKKYSYSPNRPEPSAEALRAVQDVFDFGRVASDEPIKFFYAPALVDSAWHETQDYVMTINGHKFFKEAE